ncbi:MAG: exo-alpha-sialidase [Alloprevotella sp.]|nr:exo-alpha-sialidase [Alloprevotella sp.]
MKRFTKLLVICLLVPLGTAAQIAVKAGSQITSESSLVSGKPYLVYYVGNGNSGYMKDTGDAYTGKNDETATTAAVYFFTTGSTNGTWKVQNAYTGKYWGTPTANVNTYIGASDGGDWALNFQTGGNVAPSCNEHSWNRSGSNIHPWNFGTVNVNQFKIFEVALSTTALSEFGNFDINVSSSEASTLATGMWYVMKNRGRKGYAYEVSGSLRNAAQEPYGAAANAAQYLVRLCDAGDGKYYLQNGWGNYFGIVSHNVAVPTTPFGYERYTIGTINSSAGHFYLSSETDGYVLDCQENGNPVVGWYKTIPTTTGGNNDWAFYPVTLTPSFSPAITEVYTINNTNPSRGAMMYYPAGSTRYVWSSGKNNVGFDASSANCIWVIIPTDTEKQYYLYNVGAGKFAIPSGTASTNSWIFSDDAVAVSFILQSDNTYKIKTVTTNTYAAISNNYIGPIINYNDIGGNFTITKVSGNQSAAALAAKNRLVESQTALTQSPSSDTSQWYVIRIKQHATYSDCFIYSAENEINYNGTNYPLTFDHGANIRPAISNANYFTRITPEQYWQMPNGRYLHNAVNKYPVATTIPEPVNFNYETNGFVLYHKSTGESQYTRYAVPYYLGSNFFIGETANKGNAYYDIYPINLESTGLTPWKVSILNGGDNMQLSCNRSDVSGLTKVYDGGWFFLPDDVTPTSSDFSMAQMESCIIDASNKTITVTMPAGLAITENDITVEQGFQTAGRDAEVMLLRITASPFNNAANAEIGITFKDGAEKLVSGLTLYEASSNSPEILGTGSGAPTRTAVTTTTVDGTSADVTLNIGSFTAGTHYYWLAATIKSDATLGAIVDAAVKNIVCTNGSNEITTDLTSIGDPADRGAMVFNAHSYPFLPWDEGSKIYRIPAMVVANDGSIVVAADKRYDSYSDIGGGHVIDIVVRRSTDGGKTWGTPVVVAKGDNSNDATCGYGDPTLVKTQSGKLICTSCAGNLGFNYGLKRFMVSTSSDNGITWTSPVDVTEVEGMLTNKPGLTDFFITSGKGILTSEGILMYLVIAKDGLKNYVIYSVDEGEHWVIDDQVVYTGGNEAKLELANDGSLIASVRQGGDRGFNFGTYEYSNGVVSFNWGTQYQNSQLNAGGAANNQDIIYYQRSPKTGKPDYVFHSMTTGNHANLKLYYSTDGAKNWTEFLNVQTKGTRYVTMAKAGTEENSGSLYLFFEDQSLNTSGGNTNYNHYPLNFIEITRDQLLQYIPNLDDVSSIMGHRTKRIGERGDEKRRKPFIYKELRGLRL